MRHFLIEVGKEGEILHDFSFEATQAIRFTEWFRGEREYDYSLVSGQREWKDIIPKTVSVEDIIPVGSLSFVISFLRKIGYNVENITPLNIPEFLQDERFIKREYRRGTKDELLGGESALPLFIKEAERYKGFTSIVTNEHELKDVPTNRKLDISEVVEIESEWRVFVQNDTILDAKNYVGHELFPVQPDEQVILDLVKAIEQQRYKGTPFPTAYTLDVGVNQSGTFLIECHPFVSCGLYGFSKLIRYPSMLIQGIAYFKQQAGRGECTR